MAPVPFQHPVRYPPLILAVSHVSLVVYLTYAVGASLYTSYKSLGPAQDTRSRSARRKRLVPIFFGLAVVSFLTTAYYAVTTAVLSYRTWAWEHGLDLHHRMINEDGYIADTNNSTSLYITQWLSDTPIYHDALEIVAEKARRFWWAQQHDLGILVFSAMLTLEGRRRHIPMLTAFLALAHLVSLSFAQNLFFLALLLTPAPLPSGDEDLELPVAPMPRSTWLRLLNTLTPPKPKNWMPYTRLLYFPLALNILCTLAIPYILQTPLFFRLSVVARLSTFLLLLWPKIMPAHWGQVREHGHSSRQPIISLYQFLAGALLILQIRTLVTALVSNAPDSHYHRHSALLPWDVEQRSRWEQSTNALGKVLGSTTDHPFVAAMASDVLISVLSLGAWAAVRAGISKTAVKEFVPIKKGAESDETVKIHESVVNKADSSFASAADEDHDQEQEGRMTLRRSGRTIRSRVGSIASSSGASEDVLSLAEGTRRRRGRPGRPKKTKQQPLSYDGANDDDEQTAQQKEDDQSYIPMPAEARSAAEGEGEEVASSAQELDWEMAAFTWGLAAIGGLPAACISVYGLECILH
ncbi:hypothetical protein F5Y16DRAFT_183279 [Xylariaceae sp. FL0255]|nr:hypothetical protein F5Y16DRAFT_183279 [Xylariaceae sp. FL0255]